MIAILIINIKIWKLCFAIIGVVVAAAAVVDATVPDGAVAAAVVDGVAVAVAVVVSVAVTGAFLSEAIYCHKPALPPNIKAA